MFFLKCWQDVAYYLLFVQGSGNQYRGIVDCVQTIIREEGPPALIKVRLFLFYFFDKY